MISLPAAKKMLKETYDVIQDAHQKGLRFTPEEYEQMPILIDECRNLLNCIEESYPLIRP